MRVPSAAALASTQRSIASVSQSVGGAVERRHQREHVRHLLFRALGQPEVAGDAVIEVGQDDEIADGGEPPGHVAQLVAPARRVHVEQDHRERAALLGMDDEGVHRAVGGGDVELQFDHGARLPHPCAGINAGLPTPRRVGRSPPRCR
jgi:hypothetical protein